MSTNKNWKKYLFLSFYFQLFLYNFFSSFYCFDETFLKSFYCFDETFLKLNDKHVYENTIEENNIQEEDSLNLFYFPKENIKEKEKQKCGKTF